MASLKGFWQFLNTDVKDIPWGELAEKGIESVSASRDLAEKWEEHKADLTQLEPYFAKVEPFFKVLNEPDAQMVISGLPFVSVGIGLLRLYLGLSQSKPTLDSSLIVVSQLAYLRSLEAVLATWETSMAEALNAVVFGRMLEKQLTRLATETLDSRELEKVTSCFRESNLAKQFHNVLLEELQQAGVDKAQSRRLTEHVTWGTYHYLHQAIIEVGETVEPLADYYRIGGAPKHIRQGAIDDYVREVIEPLPQEQIFDEDNPRIAFKDVYVPLKVQPLTQSGERNRNSAAMDIHGWAQGILENSGPKKVMFIQGDAGQGKSVFCRMFANWVRQNHTFPYIPLFVRLRNLRAINDNLTETLETCPDLQSVEFVGKESWLTNKNTRFLIVLDGFDELLLQGRTSGLQEFLQQVSDFQKVSHHQCLVTGRPLALQGVEQRITQDKNLARVKLEPMDDDRRGQWLSHWQKIFGEEEVTKFRTFLEACPTQVANNLAREPLLIYLLARLHREEKLTSDMFADAEQESQAKLRIYRESVNWVLKKQRQDVNESMSGLEEPDDLRFFLQEAALCVVQSGNETASLEMVKKRIHNSPVADVLKKSQEKTGLTEDKALNNLLTTFYLQPGEEDKRGSVEFAHKSFGEYLFAERLMVAFEEWTAPGYRKNQFLVDNGSLYDQIYDLLGFGGLSVEIVEYVFELLNESEINRVKLFQRLHEFYQRWCEGEFLDQAPTENLPQKKFLQLREQGIAGGLKQTDVFTGLNVLIILFKLHAAAQPEGYPQVPDDAPRPDIWFHPCGEPGTEQFDDGKLLKIIHYADVLGRSTFTQVVGPHLNSANLNSVNLNSASLNSANLNRADLNRADLNRAKLTNANLNRAKLTNAKLTNANLNSANLNSANLNSANLNSANLNNANLTSANLTSAKLTSAYLNSASLNRANLNRAYLTRAYLTSANLTSANLTSANLTSAYLNRADLTRAYLNSANLTRANLTRANLTRANLNSAYLTRANLNRAYLTRTDLTRTDLTRTYLNSANLTSANLNRAYLTSADLTSADLTRANLNSANLTRANLNSANLINTYLNSANLTSANLNSAILLGTQLSMVQNLTSQQLDGETFPLICDATLPPELEAYQDRDRELLPAAIKERYPELFESLETAETYINATHPPS